MSLRARGCGVKSLLLQQLSLAQLLFPSFEWFQKGFRWLLARKADRMPNATAFIAADHYLLLLNADGQNPLRGLAKLNAIPVYSIGNNVFKRVGCHVLPLARGQRRARNKRRFKVAANCYLRPDEPDGRPFDLNTDGTKTGHQKPMSTPNF